MDYQNIEFRAKERNTNIWVKGGIVNVLDGNTGLFHPNIVKSYNHDTFDWHDIYPDTLGQWSTLQDDKGNKIFSGDLLQPFGAGIIYFKVVFEKGCFVVYNNYGRWGTLERFFEVSHEANVQKEVIVIGNVFDNPELLKL